MKQKLELESSKLESERKKHFEDEASSGEDEGPLYRRDRLPSAKFRKASDSFEVPPEPHKAPPEPEFFTFEGQRRPKVQRFENTQVVEVSARRLSSRSSSLLSAKLGGGSRSPFNRSHNV